MDEEARELQYILQNLYRNEVEKLIHAGGSGSGVAGSSGGILGIGGSGISGSGASAASAGAAVDEPVYCYCRRVSFGQMVCCDNPTCKYEWYHFSCVGLETKPRGKWYCPDCKKKMDKEKEKDSAAAAAAASAALAGGAVDKTTASVRKEKKSRKE